MASTGTGPRGPTNLTTVRALVVASQFGVTLAVAVGLGLYVGQWLDARLGTGMVLTLIGALLGLASGVVGALQIYRAALRADAADQPTRRGTPGVGPADDDPRT